MFMSQKRKGSASQGHQLKKQSSSLQQRNQTSKPKTSLLSGASLSRCLNFCNSLPSAPNKTLGDAVKSLGSEWGDPVSALFLSVCFLIMGTSGPAHLAERVWKIRRLQQVWQGTEHGAGNEEHLCPVSSLREVSPLPHSHSAPSHACWVARRAVGSL